MHVAAAAQQYHRSCCRQIFLLLTITVMCLLSAPSIYAEGWSGYIAGEYRGFLQDPLDPAQHSNYLSVSAEPEYIRQWDDDRQSFTFTPFIRVDQHDNERGHVDIRELAWVKSSETFVWRVGVRKVFWGVTEFLHLVDIINQTDLVENIDFEDKLGQPMVNLAIINDWGTLDLFVLPGFRERTFPGVEGRLRSLPRVDTGQLQYESGQGNDHVDTAVRWSHTVGPWDMGLYYFAGTSREPRLLAGVDGNNQPVFVPRYDLIEQTGLDLQATLDRWLWKLEAIHRSGQGASYNAAAGGFEFTLYGLFGTPADLGMLTEYFYDDRGAGSPSQFQDDIGLGLRLTLNDAQSSEALVGFILDRDHRTRSFSLEASRRLGNAWKLSLEGRFFSQIPATDVQTFSLRRDDLFQLELARYF